MALTRIPKHVRDHLMPNEEVVGRFSSLWREFYATNQRVVGFWRPDWVAFFFILGLLPGILILLLTQKAYLGAAEYSAISRVSHKTGREVLPVILGLVLGVPMVILGVVLLPAGLILIIMGLFVVAGCWYARPSAYQFEIQGMRSSESRRWFFSKAKGLRSTNEADEFAELVAEKAGQRG